MEAIVITITGPRGIGKTTTAARIVALLRSHGHEVRYRGFSGEQEDAIERLIADDDAGHWGDARDERRKFIIRDWQ